VKWWLVEAIRLVMDFISLKQPPFHERKWYTFISQFTQHHISWVKKGSIIINPIIYRKQMDSLILRYPRLKPWYSKQFKLRLTPLGDYTFTHGLARGTLPFGLVEGTCRKHRIQQINQKIKNI